MEEIRSAARTLVRRPVYSFLAAAILALGLSAGVAVFTYVNGFHQPFPGADPDGLVQLFDASDEDPFGVFSYRDFRDYAQGASKAFSDLAAVSSG
ncbi:MAG TPA: hypothetical protein VJ997_07770, partial [Longimicrobiales bacterium]|nr:hypothetical protein [Longimicrobiales bacterium]